LKDKMIEIQSQGKFYGVGADRVRIFGILLLRLSRLGLFVELCGGGGGGGWIVGVRRPSGPGSGIRQAAGDEDLNGCFLEAGQAP